MAVQVMLDLPPELEQRLRLETPELEEEVKEAYFLSLFRRGRLTHGELSRALGVTRFEVDALLKRQGIFDGGLTMADLDADQRTLDAVMRRGKQC